MTRRILIAAPQGLSKCTTSETLFFKRTHRNMRRGSRNVLLGPPVGLCHYAVPCSTHAFPVALPSYIGSRLLYGSTAHSVSVLLLLQGRFSAWSLSTAIIQSAHYSRLGFLILQTYVEPRPQHRLPLPGRGNDEYFNNLQFLITLRTQLIQRPI